MLVINLICIYFGITPKYIDGFVLIFLIGNLASKYMLYHENILSSKEYWTLFFGSLTIYILYNALALFSLSYYMVISVNFIFFAFIFVSIIGALCSFLGLWRAKRLYEKSTPQPTPIKVHSVTDEAIASYIINELSKHKISAYIDRLNLQHDPLLSALPTAKVHIMLHDSSDIHKATDIISMLFDEDDGYEPWNCPECQVENDGSFFMCWKCGYEQT